MWRGNIAFYVEVTPVCLVEEQAVWARSTFGGVALVRFGEI